AVAVHAPWRQSIATSSRLAVQRFRKLLRFVAVAGTAVDLGQRRGVRQFLAFQIGVAGSALQRAVDGTGELLLVHEERHGPPTALGGQRLIAMACQAVIAGGSLRGPALRQK